MLPFDLDAIDVRILEELQADARLTNVELARRINLSASPCLARVRALESRGVISRHVALVDPATVGLHVSVFIQVTLERQTKDVLDEFEREISKHDEVMECYLMTGVSDYLLRVVLPDVRALQQFIVDHLATIKGIANIRSSVALQQVKYKTALPLSATGLRTATAARRA